MGRFMTIERVRKTVLLSVWGGLILLAMAQLLNYQMEPAAEAGTAPGQWPADSSVARDLSRPTLVMLLHPQCPCSSASVHELAELMARAGDRLTARVVFIDPAGAPDGWDYGDLWKQAAAIPDVTLSVDRGGNDSRLFAATTSGDVVMYNSAGRLMFSGGITYSRGHEGDNAGLSAILELVRDGKSDTQHTPVYGCSLTGPTLAATSQKAQ
jgi:hypothetical protein